MMYPSGLYSYKHMIEYMCVHMSTYIICYFIPFFAETSGIKIDLGRDWRYGVLYLLFLLTYNDMLYSI